MFCSSKLLKTIQGKWWICCAAGGLLQTTRVSRALQAPESKIVVIDERRAVVRALASPRLDLCLKLANFAHNFSLWRGARADA